MTRLGLNWIAYGFARQRHHVFLATGLTLTQNNPDAEEHDIAVRSLPIAEFERMMLAGAIRDDAPRPPGGCISSGRRGRPERFRICGSAASSPFGSDSRHKPKPLIPE